MARPRHLHDRLWFPAGAAKGRGVDGMASTRDPRAVTRRCSRMRELGGCRRRRHRRGWPRRRHGPPSSRRRRRARGGLSCRRSSRRSGRRGRRRRRTWRASGRARLRWRSSLVAGRGGEGGIVLRAFSETSNRSGCNRQRLRGRCAAAEEKSQHMLTRPTAQFEPSGS